MRRSYKGTSGDYERKDFLEKNIVKEGVLNIIAFNITFGRKREVLI